MTTLKNREMQKYMEDILLEIALEIGAPPSQDGAAQCLSQSFFWPG